MKKKKSILLVQNPRNELPDHVLVSAICLLGAGIGVFLFWQNLNLTMTKQNEDPIGYVVFKERIAQRRFGDRTAWDTLKPNSPIYNNDIIHTADLSEASILFPNGDRFELRENSIVQIVANTQGTRLELSGGNINIQTAEQRESPLTLIAVGHELILDSGSLISAGTEGDANLYVNVVEGMVNITTAKGIQQNAEAGTGLAVTDRGQIARKTGIAVLQPKPSVQMVNYRGGLVPVYFSWKTADLESTEPIRLEIARNRTFTQVSKQFDSTDVLELSVDLESGTWYWRIYPVSQAAGTAESKVSGKIVILDPPQLNPISPAAGKIFTYRANLPAITFSWDTPSRNDWSYQVLVADNPRMERPVYTGPVAGNSLMYSGLGSGTWYWQVKPVFTADLDTGGLATSPILFSIIRSGSLRAPELLVPMPDSLLVVERTGNEFFFSWKQADEANTYTVQIAGSPDLHHPLIVRQLSNNYFIYHTSENILSQGDYFWGVVYTDNDGIDSPISPIRSFKVQLPQEIPDYPARIAEAFTEISRAKALALQQDWPAALESYKKLGSALDFSEDQTKILLEGIMAFQNERERADLQEQLVGLQSENIRFTRENEALWQENLNQQQTSTAVQEVLQRQIAEKDAEIARIISEQQSVYETAQWHIASLTSKVSSLTEENTRLLELQPRASRSLADREKRMLQLETENRRLDHTREALTKDLNTMTAQAKRSTEEVNQVKSNFTRLSNDYTAIKPNSDAYLALRQAYTAYQKSPPGLPRLKTFLSSREVRTPLPGFAEQVNAITDEVIFSTYKENITTVTSILETALRIENRNTRKSYLQGIQERYAKEPLLANLIAMLLEWL